MVTNKRGGTRPGAGRKPKDGEIRKSRTLRATDEEWKKILEFAKILKKREKNQ